MWDFPLFPDQASTVAPEVDAVYFALIGLASFFMIIIGCAALYFLVRYRKGSDADRSDPQTNNWKLEAFWIGVPFLMAMAIFFWGTNKYFEIQEIPEDTVEVFVLGKQWMWKVQHPQGKREIDELHVPANRPVMLRMTSQDVIHSFFVPAFRIKQDVVPGRYTTVWFEATKPGRYRLMCAEYCGTGHSRMLGEVVVLSQADYAAWLEGGEVEETLAQRGEKIFNRAGCSGCHVPDSAARAPILTGLYGQRVQLESGEAVVADEAYLRDSILLPQKHIVAGYEAIMPSYQGQLSEAEVFALVEYIKSLSEEETK